MKNMCYFVKWDKIIFKKMSNKITYFNSDKFSWPHFKAVTIEEKLYIY